MMWLLLILAIFSPVFLIVYVIVWDCIIGPIKIAGAIWSWTKKDRKRLKVLLKGLPEVDEIKWGDLPPELTFEDRILISRYQRLIKTIFVNEEEVS